MNILSTESTVSYTAPVQEITFEQSNSTHTHTLHVFVVYLLIGDIIMAAEILREY